MKKHKGIWAAAIFYAAVLIIKYAVGGVLKLYGLEYRMWTDTMLSVIIWLLPALLPGIILISYTIRLGRSDDNRKRHKVFVCISIIYCFAASIVLMAGGVYGIAGLNDEEMMPDGNLCIAVPVFQDQTEYDYAEAESVFIRRPFKWDDEKKAESLGKIYDTRFTIDKKEENVTRFIPENCKSVSVRVYSIGHSGYSYFDDDFMEKLTSLLIGQNFYNVFRHNEAYDWYRQDGRDSYKTLVVYRKDISEASKDISVFIKKLSGTGEFKDYSLIMTVLVKDIPSDEGYPVSFYMDADAGDYSDADYVYDKLMVGANIIENENDEKIGSLSEAYSDEGQTAEDEEEHEPDVTTDTTYPGYHAIYLEIFGSGENTETYYYDVKGKLCLTLSSDEKTKRELIFDRDSKNGKCGIYVYYKENADSNDDFSPYDNTSIIDMYAYEYDTGKITDSGRKAWADLGSQEYRDATGE